MQSVKEGRITKSKAKPRTTTRRVSSKMPLVERTNALSIDDFIAQYVIPPTQAEEAKNDAIDQPHPSQNQAQQNMTFPPNVDVYSAATIPTADLEACLNLIEQTSSEAYIASSAGWSRTKKLKEMKLPDMKYLILRPNDSGDSSGHPEKQSDIVDNNAASPLKKSDDPVSSSGTASRIVLGFLSFMVTYEDGKEVVYCYEIHLSPAARGRGVGKLLMGQMERIGRAVGLEKAMLTVFKSNEVARRFYDRLGYEIDGYSPRPRKLRNGTIKDVDYLILSKRLKL